MDAKLVATSTFDFLKRILRDFVEDECSVRAAALAYYTVFALPPLLILLTVVVGAFWDPADVQRSLETQFSTLVGNEGGRAIREMLEHAKRPGAGGVLATVLGVGALLFGALGAFMQLQGALNRAWEVKPDPTKGGIRRFFAKRVLSAGMILAVAFLLMISLAVSALLSALGARMDFIPAPALHAADVTLSFAVITVLFAAIFRFLPDAEIAWRDVWLGALVTSVLFVVGKFVIGFYLGRSAPGDPYGAAGALAVILVWIYYGGMIVLFGAEFTQGWAQRRGAWNPPEPGAVNVKHVELESDAPTRGLAADR
jgi:membrane protein